MCPRALDTNITFFFLKKNGFTAVMKYTSSCSQRGIAIKCMYVWIFNIC